MDQNEVVLRAIGILTEAQNMFAALNEDPDADYELSPAFATLINEVLPTVLVPEDASPREAAETAAQAVAASALQLVHAFAFLFSELADVHDAGHSDIKSADLLQDLALRFSHPPQDEDED
jgi:hypothetical protein